MGVVLQVAIAIVAKAKTRRMPCFGACLECSEDREVGLYHSQGIRSPLGREVEEPLYEAAAVAEPWSGVRLEAEEASQTAAVVGGAAVRRVLRDQNSLMRREQGSGRPWLLEQVSRDSFFGFVLANWKT